MLTERGAFYFPFARGLPQNPSCGYSIAQYQVVSGLVANIFSFWSINFYPAFFSSLAAFLVSLLASLLACSNEK